MSSKREIKRKWLVIEPPDLNGREAVSYERYYLEKRDGYEKRIQKKGDKYEMEEVTEASPLTRNKTKTELTQEEFEVLKEESLGSTARDSYLISENPLITLRIYHDKFEGLNRAEVEFETEDEANAFTTLSWFGKEITDSPLGKDGKLINLSNEEFKTLLEQNRV